MIPEMLLNSDMVLVWDLSLLASINTRWYYDQYSDNWTQTKYRLNLLRIFDLFSKISKLRAFQFKRFHLVITDLEKYFKLNPNKHSQTLDLNGKKILQIETEKKYSHLNFPFNCEFWLFQTFFRRTKKQEWKIKYANHAVISILQGKWIKAIPCSIFKLANCITKEIRRSLHEFGASSR